MGFKIRNTPKNRAVLIGIAVIFKLLLMGLFSSDYQDRMFIPFVENFLSGHNPYQYYYDNSLLYSFPYMPLMLLTESVGGGILLALNTGSVFVQNLVFKLPLLAFDLIGYFFYRKMNIRFKYVYIFYFWSPVILYSAYVHGQLDIIPTTLLVISVYYLTCWRKKHNLLWCGLFLGLALSTKLHIIAAVPIIFLYIAAKKGYLEAARSMLISAAVILLFYLPFAGSGIVNNVIMNREQSLLLSVQLDYGTTQVLIPVAALLVIYFKTYDLKYFSKDLLISMLGMLFAVFLILIPPMPGWFVWVVPFIALYFGFVNNDKYKVMAIYSGFNLLYLLYFIFLHHTEYVDISFLGRSLQGIKLLDNSARNLIFTALVVLLGMVVYKIYVFGIASNNLYRRGNVPFTIGIAGDSGAGKSRLLEKIEHLFGGGKDILFIEGDGDHRWERNDDNWEIYTSLDPKANYLYKQAKDIAELRRGNRVTRVEYDHDKGIFSSERSVRPKNYIVLCGLHSLYLPQLRREMDLKIFMDTDPELRKFWKIDRDTHERGYSMEQINAQIEKRMPDAKRYVYPQKQYADLIITYFDDTLERCEDTQHEVLLSVKLTVDINIDMEDIVSCFEEYGVHPRWRICDGNLRQEVVFDGAELKNNTIDFEELAEENIPQYEDIFTYTPTWGEGVEGVIQLFLLVIISGKMRGDMEV